MSSSVPEVCNFGQRLLGRITSDCPVVKPLLEQTIVNLSNSCQDINSFRRLLNQSLRFNLANLSVDTMEIRIMLDDDDNLEYWYHNLINTVLPFYGEHSVKE